MVNKNPSIRAWPNILGKLTLYKKNSLICLTGWICRGWKNIPSGIAWWTKIWKYKKKFADLFNWLDYMKNIIPPVFGWSEIFIFYLFNTVLELIKHEKSEKKFLFYVYKYLELIKYRFLLNYIKNYIFYKFIHFFSVFLKNFVLKGVYYNTPTQ